MIQAHDFCHCPLQDHVYAFPVGGNDADQTHMFIGVSEGAFVSGHFWPISSVQIEPEEGARRLNSDANNAITITDSVPVGAYPAGPVRGDGARTPSPLPSC